MYDNLLPNGSVLLLKGARRRVMTVGRVVAMEGGDEVFDYCAPPFPQGLSAADSLVFFNRDAIETVYFIGCQDIEELQFREQVLAPLGELYVDENGQIVERERAEETAVEPESTVFADVD